ncbi:MAG TPA: HDOD domain-containing protein [Acidobacteriota bacterium]|nr:HDOD domain-containing protein [Acidobacteriota bacterium]
MAIPDLVLDGIDRLNPLPITAQKLVLLLNEEEADFRKIVEVVEYDGAIASNLLRVANSIAFGGRVPIKNLKDAVVRLGPTVLLHIIMVEHLRAFGSNAPMYDLTEDDLWLHGAAASLAVKAMMTEARNARTIPQISAVAALIHDIGKLIMVRYLDCNVSRLRALCEERRCTFVDAEREILGCDHAEVGGAMARKWGFPESVRVAIEWHHMVPPPRPSPVLDAVVLSNLAAKKVGVGLGAEGMNIRVDFNGALKRLGLEVKGFEKICAQTSIWLKDLRQRQLN